MSVGFWSRMALRAWAALVLLFLFIPILLIFFYAFNTSNIESWPIPGLTTRWFSSTWNDATVRSALLLSVQVGIAATAVALILGLMALLPLVVGRRPAPPPPAPNPTTPQFASLLAQTAPSLALKRPLLSAFLLAVALGMMARGSSSEKK